LTARKARRRTPAPIRARRRTGCSKTGPSAPAAANRIVQGR
jgi:hypothetical protein